MAEKKQLTTRQITFIVSTIYLITADKGGTGKSMTTRIIIDSLLAAGVPFTLMECDIGIPDTTHIFGGTRDTISTRLKAGGASMMICWLPH